ncbi:ABC transporter ATP-binding protein [Gorillibacterium timonense]|uniref:ABC transporter ATP-binding protein n=1 Tax=Gorillibacterium timonense TaxID=1689269 RepID=UPI00071C3B6A|nr:ABC transporter ATP-binding protein [Gorillibacterium timonense]
MRTLLSFVKPYRKTAIIAIVLMLTELAVELWHPLLMRYIINKGVIPQDMTEVLRYGGIMLAISLVGFAAGIINSFYASRVSQGVGADLRGALFERLEKTSYADFGRFPASTLITRITSDVSQVQNIVFMGLRVMLRAPLMMIGGLTLALTLQFRVSFALILVTPLLILAMIHVIRKGFGLFRSVQERLDRTNGVMRESLTGMRWIRALVRSRHEVDRFTSASGELMEKTISASRWMELTIPVLLFVMNLCILFILWFGSREVEASRANVGDIVAVVNYATRITGAFGMLSWILSSVSRARASWGRIGEVLVLPEESTSAGKGAADQTNRMAAGERRESGDGEGPEEALDGESGPSAAALRAASVTFEQVSFAYPGMAEPALEGISFVAEPGQMVAVLGATGSGKTTLMQLIPRLYRPKTGRILLDGRDTAELPAETLLAGIGYVPQEIQLFSGTIRENLLWGKEEATAEELAAAAQDAQIHETIMRLPDQYETMLGQNGVNLSGGQKQRLSIARALIRKPRLLLLDDSTSALDLKTEARLLAALGKYRCTTLLITQKISTAMEADRILILEDGRLIAEGDHESLLDTSTLYRKIVESQFGVKEAAGHERHE